MPREFSVTLIRQGQDEIGTIPESVKSAGLVEFFSNRPLYMAEFYGLYKYCRVLSATLEVDFFNKGDNPVAVVVGHVPYSDFSGITFDRISERPLSTKKLLSAAGGMDKARIVKHFPVQNLIGNPHLSKYWVTAAQSTSGTPIDTEEPIIVFGARFAGGFTDISVVYNWKIKYNLQFFDLETPPDS